MALSKTVAFTGVGFSRLSRGDAPDPRSLTYAACMNAVADAGLVANDVEGIFQYVHNDLEAPNATWVQRQLGIRNLAAFVDLRATGPSGVGPAMFAAMAVASGVVDVALAYRTLGQRDGNNGRLAPAGKFGGPAQFTGVYGHGAPLLANYAMKKRRRLFEFGSVEDYGLIAINARRWAALNDRACLRDPITMNDYLGSRMIVDPLVLLDCDYPVNGSCAVVVTSEERARDSPHRPVYVDSLAWGSGPGGDFNFHDDFLFGGSIDCGRRLWSRSSFIPSDVDLVELYDGFTHLPISWIEALGFCGVGEFHDWVADGDTIAPGGKLPLNTSGGMLAEGRLQGIGLVAEAVQQLRGDAGLRQVPGAKVAVVAGGGSNDCGAMVLAV